MLVDKMCLHLIKHPFVLCKVGDKLLETNYCIIISGSVTCIKKSFCFNIHFINQHNFSEPPERFLNTSYRNLFKIGLRYEE